MLKVNANLCTIEPVPGCHVSLVCLFGVGWGCVVVGSDSFERLNVIDPAMGFVMVKLVVFDAFAWFAGFAIFFNGEFDPGSGRTLAACLTHASRTVRPLRGYTSGERVSNT